MADIEITCHVANRGKRGLQKSQYLDYTIYDVDDADVAKIHAVKLAEQHFQYVRVVNWRNVTVTSKRR
jgi:hypothetical protein